MYTMKESVAVAKEADAKKGVSPTRSDNSIHRVRDEPERQLGSLRDVIGNIRHDGCTPSVESIATELSGMHTAQRAPVLLGLQQTHGNRYVQLVVSGIQAKLKVGQPGDKYEQEADRVADQIMRMPEPVVQPKPTSPPSQSPSCGDEDTEGESIQTRAIAEEITPLIQRRPEEEEEPIEELEEEEEPIMTKALSYGTLQVTDGLRARLNRSKGGGQQLPETDRNFMERRFEVGFSGVRIHTDSNAVQMSRYLNAQAFTHGKDIYFGAGQYNSGSHDGRRLLAHELTHIAQQAGQENIIQLECAADPDFARTYTYWAWIDNKILNWQVIALSRVRFWLQNVLIGSTRTRTAVLSTRLARTEREVASAESNAVNVGLAFTGNMLWVLAGIGPQRPLVRALQVGGALIASTSALAFGESRAVTPEFLDNIGGLSGLVINIGQAVQSSLAQMGSGKRRVASESLCRLAAVTSATPVEIYRTLFHDTFPELPDSIAAAQGPASVPETSAPVITSAPHVVEGATTGTTPRAAVPSLTAPSMVDTDFLTAVESYIMLRLQAYMTHVSSEARAVLRDRRSVSERISSGSAVSEQELSDTMEYIGITETAESMAATITGGTREVQASELFNQLQGLLANESYRVRLTAIMSLTRLTIRGRSYRELVIPELIRMLNDDENIVRVIASDSLAQLNAVLAIPAIYRVLGSIDDEDQRNIVQRALERLLGHASRQ